MFLKHYLKYKDKIYTHFVYRIQNESIAQDLASETFLKAYKYYHSYDNNYAFSTWLYTIARNVLIDYYKKQGREIQTDFSDEIIQNTYESEDELPDFYVNNELDLQKIYRAFEELSEINRTCMIYKYIDDLSTKEIAEITNTKEATIRKRISRSTKLLKDYIQKNYQI